MRAFPVLLVCGLPVALTAQAPDTTRADTARHIAPVNVTGTRAPAAVGGASAVVVKPEALRASPAPLLEDALRESPFVHVRQNSRGEMELSIRGSDSRQAAVLMDGVPLSIGWDHRVDPSLVPITGAQSIVIVRGLASLLNGPNTLGGVIDVSHDDAADGIGDGRVWGGFGVDVYHAYVATAGAGRKLEGRARGALSARAGAAHRQRDGFALAAGVPDATATDGLRTNSDLRETDAFATLRWRSAMGRSLGLTVSGFAAERGVPPEEHLSAPRLWRYPDDRRLAASLSASAGTFATPLGFGTAELGAGFHAGRVKIQSFGDRSYSTPVAEERGDERTVSMRAAASHSLPQEARVKGAVTVATVDYRESFPSVAPADYRQWLISAGGELEIPLATRLTLSGGAVYDRAATPLTGGRTAGGETLDATGMRIGVTHDLDAHWRWHASASRRSRFPSLRELYSGALDRFLPNPNLRPETLTGVEAGITVDRAIGPIPDATFQLTAFHHALDHAVARVTLPPPDRRFLRINRDRMRSAGVELLAGLVLGPDRERAIMITADGLLQDISIVDPTALGAAARHAESNPESRGMVEVSAPILGLRGFANTRLTGPQYCLNADTGTEMRLPGTAKTSFAVERRLALSKSRAIRSIRAILAMDNVADVAVYDQCGLSQPGRTLRLVVSWQ